MSEICVSGSSAFELPQHFSEVQAEREQDGLMSVAEGDGIVISIDKNKLDEVSVFTVWPADLVLEQRGTACYAMENALLNIRKDNAGSIWFSIYAGQ